MHIQEIDYMIENQSIIQVSKNASRNQTHGELDINIAQSKSFAKKVEKNQCYPREYCQEETLSVKHAPGSACISDVTNIEEVRNYLNHRGLIVGAVWYRDLNNPLG